MTRVFREKHPKRTQGIPAESYYKNYRMQLEQDFNGRCGYTDCSQVHWFGGFEIDHFAPLKPHGVDDAGRLAFGKLECVYGNLVYACPSVNRAKGNDWAGQTPSESVKDNKGYLDPCDHDFNLYFYRTDGGQIMPTDNAVAKYMWSKLNLYLKRYEIYWRIDYLWSRIQILYELIELQDFDQEKAKRVEQLLADLNKKYHEYMKYINAQYTAVTRS